MGDYEDENWVALYRLAVVELEHARMSGRIEAAQAAIVARMEALQHMPRLHADERQPSETPFPVFEFYKMRSDGTTKTRNAML
jgi:hypothetical protein